MDDIYTTNIAVVQHRWPVLKQFLEQQVADQLNVELIEGLSSTIKIDGVQLSSRHDRLREAVQQVASIENKVEIHLYGCGLGDVPRELLKRKQLEKLHIHILNEQLFSLCLHLLPQDDWLCDPRVALQLAVEHKEIQQPFFAIPAELFLASDLNAKIRDRLVAEIELPYINQKFKPQNAHIQNRIQENIPYLEADPDAGSLFNACINQHAFVLASGPSLELHYEKLRKIREQEQRPIFVALDTAVRPLMVHGIEPDFVISIDQHITSGHFPASLSDKAKLIYFPLAQASTLEYWPGPRYAAYSQSPIYDEIAQLVPKIRLFSSGSVLHPAVDFTVKLGVKSITLFGADFSYPLNKTHSGWADGALGEPVAAAKYWVLNGRGERVKTLLNFRSYLCALERYISHHPEIEFFNSSQIGALIDGTTFHPEFI